MGITRSISYTSKKGIERYVVLINILFTVIYMMEYHYSYSHFVCDAYDYTNISHRAEGDINYWFMYLFACAPLLFFKNIHNVASGFSFMSYVLIYIPFINTLFSSTLPHNLSLLYSISFLVIMIAFFVTDNLYLFRDSYLRRSANPVVNFKTFEYSAVALFLLLVFLNRHNLSYFNMFSESDELYAFREGDALAKSGGVLGLYLLLWMENIFLPILLVCSYQKQQRLKFFAYLLAFVVTYMMTKTKVTIVMPFVMWGALFLYKRHKLFTEKFFHIIFIIILGLSSLFLCKQYEKNILYTPFATLLNYRIQSVEGAQLERYLNFFEVNKNPHTYYSHIQVVNAVIQSYPYKESIGKAVAGNGSNSNATFLLMDGVAACGVLGCFIAAFLFIILKSTLNPLSKRFEYFALIIILLYSFNSVINTSLFTSLVSFGMIPFYIVMKYVSLPPICKD